MFWKAFSIRFGEKLSAYPKILEKSYKFLEGLEKKLRIFKRFE
jgi:hypothetical protein